MIVGTEWLIEASGCSVDALRDEYVLQQLSADVMNDLGLKSLESVWHKFPGEGGVTGIALLTESHLTCHTYPEHGTATFNLYCCRSRPDWDWHGNLSRRLYARSVSITKLDRGVPRDIRALEEAA